MNLPPNRRFVPTLTDVVDTLPHTAPLPPASLPRVAVTELQTDALVEEVVQQVSQQLEELIRHAVESQLKAQQLRVVQTLRDELRPSVRPLVLAALAGVEFQGNPPAP